MSKIYPAVSLLMALSVPAALASTPLTFEENFGQSDARYGYVFEGHDARIGLSPTGASIEGPGVAPFRLTFVCAEPHSRAEPLQPSPALSHYFRGSVPARWIVGARHFGRVVYERVYPGVDVAYYGNDGQLEYDVVLAPGANLRRVRVRMDGATAVRLTAEGTAEVAIGGRTVTHLRPVAYQDLPSGRRKVDVRYAQRGPLELGFVIGRHDRHYPVVIDPAIVFSTYLGNGGWDEGNGVAVDAAGNAYVAGLTTTSKGKEASVAKFSPTGQLLYQTLLGGARDDGATSITVDAAGNAYIAGWSWSSDFPTKSAYSTQFSGSYDDGFAAKLDPGGVVVYSTYLPGNGEDHANAIAIDPAGNAYVAGRTTSSDFPRVGALQSANAGGDDAFVLKLSAAGNALLFSTYLGGTGRDAAHALVVSGSSVWVAGGTSSLDFPTMGALQSSFGGGADDAFVTRLSTSGALQYSTYLGGADHESAQGIAVDSGGAVYLTGWRLEFPPALFGWVARLEPLGASLGYAIEGRGGQGIAVDAGGQAYVTGADGFFYSKLLPTGGTSFDAAGFGGRSVALTSGGDVVVTGATDSTELQTVNPYQAHHGDIHTSESNYGATTRRWDAFVTRFTDGPTPTPSPTSAATPTFTPTPRSAATATSTATGTAAATPTPTPTPRATPTTPPRGTPTATVAPGPPFGSFDTPANGTANLSGGLAVTGWALDDTGVTRVGVYRDPVAGDPGPGPNGKIFIGDATFVVGARPDVATSFPQYPQSNRAGWGYMLLTNMLPDLVGHHPAGGNGTFTLYAYAFDTAGNQALLGARTFGAQNTGATKPFGTIDTPGQGQTVSGVLSNFGWVLTPQPAAIATDGSTIHLVIDGQTLGTAQYNLHRDDIAAAFPGYANSNGAVGFFSIDTHTLSNGVHTLAWTVTDNAGHADGIGSRYFTVQN